MLAVVCVAVFMLLLDITVVNVALPEIDKELNTSFTDLQWVVDAYALTLAATMLNAGSLGDLLGRKRVFLVAITLFTVLFMFGAVLTIIGSFFRGPGYNWIWPWAQGVFFEL